MIGPGKYDEICTYVRETTKAEGVILMVKNGEFGNGFGVQMTPRDLMEMPRVLRFMADQIEADSKKGMM